MAPDTLDLHRLKAVVARLLDETINDNGSASLKLEHNFYWQVDFDERFDMSRQPSLSMIGSLIDDWELTRDLASETGKVASYALTEVAPLLDYIGNTLARRSGR